MNQPWMDGMKNKVCVITGGGGIICSELARGLATVGVNIALIDLKTEAASALANDLASQYGIKAISIQANVLDKASLQEAKKVVNAKLGPVNMLINGAGGNSPKATTKSEQFESGSSPEDTFLGLAMEEFRKVFDLNFIGTLLPTMVFSTDMIELKEGAVLNISSMNSFRPLTKIPAYSAAKASVNNFTQWLAVHLARVGIRVNAIAPGFFLTNQNRFLMTIEETGELSPRGKKVMAATPMGRFGEPSELIGATVFLLSDMSKFITGVVIPIDGGYNAFGGV
jgi:NAD(P)-dependent dehydrogenase (short-subunit alcohol dehydrogenase family)